MRVIACEAPATDTRKKLFGLVQVGAAFDLNARFEQRELQEVAPVQWQVDLFAVDHTVDLVFGGVDRRGFAGDDDGLVGTPTSRLKSLVTLSPTCSVREVSEALKPLTVTLMSYSPGGSALKRYSPVELLSVTRSAPVALLVAVTFGR